MLGNPILWWPWIAVREAVTNNVLNGITVEGTIFSWRGGLPQALSLCYLNIHSQKEFCLAPLQSYPKMWLRIIFFQLRPDSWIPGKQEQTKFDFLGACLIGTALSFPWMTSSLFWKSLLFFPMSFSTTWGQYQCVVIDVLPCLVPWCSWMSTGDV